MRPTQPADNYCEAKAETERDNCVDVDERAPVDQETVDSFQHDAGSCPQSAGNLSMRESPN